MDKKLTLPLSSQQLLSLKAGERVLLSGVIYTLRDAGHKRLVESYINGKPDFDVKDKAFYYCGPTPTLEGEIIGSCGPTTSTRMDDYTPFLLERGLKITIGKGKRRQDVIDSMIKNKAVYLVAIGGAAALYKSCVKKNVTLAYADLGCEALRALTVENMDLMVAVDTNGNTILK